ncbi:hypothetical protein M378DRAFT_541423, partial [Amanita muscaria Koide BX008]
ATGDRSAVFRSLIEGVIPRVVQKQPDGATKTLQVGSMLDFLWVVAPFVRSSH